MPISDFLHLLYTELVKGTGGDDRGEVGPLTLPVRDTEALGEGVEGRLRLQTEI